MSNQLAVVLLYLDNVIGFGLLSDSGSSLMDWQYFPEKATRTRLPSYKAVVYEDKNTDFISFVFLSRKERKTSYCDNAGWLDDFPWGWCDLGMPKKSDEKGK